MSPRKNFFSFKIKWGEGRKKTNKLRLATNPQVLKFSAPSQKVAHCVTQMKVLVVCPVGGAEKAGGLHHYLLTRLHTHTHTHTHLMPFSMNWGKFQTNLPRLSHPVLSQFIPGASKREGEGEGEEEEESCC